MLLRLTKNNEAFHQLYARAKNKNWRSFKWHKTQKGSPSLCNWAITDVLAVETRQWLRIECVLGLVHGVMRGSCVTGRAHLHLMKIYTIIIK